MSNFRVGQKVVCVNPNELLVRGAVYTIEHIANPCCGVSLFVGVRMRKLGYTGMTRCSDCGSEFPRVFGTQNGFRTERFRPLDSLEEQIEAIEEEGAPVELEPEYA